MSLPNKPAPPKTVLEIDSPASPAADAFGQQGRIAGGGFAPPPGGVPDRNRGPGIAQAPSGWGMGSGFSAPAVPVQTVAEVPQGPGPVAGQGAAPRALSGGMRTVFDDGGSSAPAAGPSAPTPAVASAPQRALAAILVSADRKEAHLLYDGANRVGRGSKAEVMLHDPTVSEVHCNIICKPDAVRLMPSAEAANFVTIDGDEVYETRLVPSGARLKIGRVTWTLVVFPQG